MLQIITSKSGPSFRSFSSINFEVGKSGEDEGTATQRKENRKGGEEGSRKREMKRQERRRGATDEDERTGGGWRVEKKEVYSSFYFPREKRGFLDPLTICPDPCPDLLEWSGRQGSGGRENGREARSTARRGRTEGKRDGPRAGLADCSNSSIRLPNQTP